MFYLYQSSESGRYRFYNDTDHSFSIIGFQDIPAGYDHFMRNTLLGSSTTFTEANLVLIASSPTPKSFPDLYPEFFI